MLINNLVADNKCMVCHGRGWVAGEDGEQKCSQENCIAGLIISKEILDEPEPTAAIT